MTKIPTNAMVQGDGKGRACFTISEDLTVCMSDGETISLSIKLTPCEARGFARVLEDYADLVDEDGELSIVDCAGAA